MGDRQPIDSAPKSIKILQCGRILFGLFAPKTHPMQYFITQIKQLGQHQKIGIISEISPRHPKQKCICLEKIASLIGPALYKHSITYIIRLWFMSPRGKVRGGHRSAHSWTPRTAPLCDKLASSASATTLKLL